MVLEPTTIRLSVRHNGREYTHNYAISQMVLADQDGARIFDLAIDRLKRAIRKHFSEVLKMTIFDPMPTCTGMIGMIQPSTTTTPMPEWPAQASIKPGFMEGMPRPEPAPIWAVAESLTERLKSRPLLGCGDVARLSELLLELQAVVNEPWFTRALGLAKVNASGPQQPPENLAEGLKRMNSAL